MNIIVQIFDVVAAFLTVLTLNLVRKNYRWWLLYAAGSVLFTITMVLKQSIGYTIMGIILSFTGINNYRAGRLKEKKKRSKNSISLREGLMILLLLY